MSFVTVGLTHELRLEEYCAELVRQNGEIIEQNKNIERRLDYIALILERDAETGSTLSEIPE